jgi:hypothetical protein
MFDRNQKRSLVIAGVALLAGLLVGALGCDGSGAATAITDGGHVGDARTVKPTGANPCAPAVTVASNPTTGCARVSYTGYTAGIQYVCGWDPTNNVCYTTVWCEPSVPSTQTNTYESVALAQASPNLRPASADCSKGAMFYSYPAGSILLWGGDFTESVYSTPTNPNDGYVCLPNTQTFTILC